MHLSHAGRQQRPPRPYLKNKLLLVSEIKRQAPSWKQRGWDGGGWERSAERSLTAHSDTLAASKVTASFLCLLLEAEPGVLPVDGAFCLGGVC